MEERLLKFVGLIDAGSYTKAARVMHISQPALTMAIKQLEKELGKTLLVRHGKRFAPTTAGKEAYIAGRKIKASIEKLRSQIDTPSKPKVFAIGMIDSVAKQLFADPATVESLFSFANISISVNNTDRLLAELQNNRLQYVIGTKSKSYDGRLTHATELAQEPMVCVTASDKIHETSKLLEKHRTIKDFISYNLESNTHALIRDRLAELGIKADISTHSTSPEVMKDLVLMGYGTAFLPLSSVQPLVSRGLLGTIGGKELVVRRPIWVYKSVFGEPPLVVNNLQETLKQILD
jgi:LysR family nitrogen assimilation transcriptional regulator